MNEHDAFHCCPFCFDSSDFAVCLEFRNWLTLDVNVTFLQSHAAVAVKGRFQKMENWKSIERFGSPWPQQPFQSLDALLWTHCQRSLMFSQKHVGSYINSRPSSILDQFQGWKPKTFQKKTGSFDIPNSQSHHSIWSYVMCKCGATPWANYL